MRIVKFTPEKLKGLKAALKKEQDANKDRHATFMFDGAEYVVGYAAYLVEYLEAKKCDESRSMGHSTGKGASSWLDLPRS